MSRSLFALMSNQENIWWLNDNARFFQPIFVACLNSNCVKIMSPINKHEIRGTFKPRITDIIFGNWQLYSIGKLGLTFRNSYDFIQLVYHS